MALDQMLAYLVFAVVAAGTPGPANVLVAATGAQVGVWRGIPCLLGVAVGTGVLLGTVALGIGSALLEQPQLLLFMKLAGAALLLWLAWKIATAAPTTSQELGHQKPAGFTVACLLQWINPKPWIVAVSAAATYLDSASENPVGQALLFTVLFVVAAVPASAVWLIGGSAISRLLSSERRRRAFNMTMGLLLAGSVALVFV